MRKYLYLIKKKKIKSWLKFWLLTNNKFNSILSSIIYGTSFNLQNTVKRYFKIFNIFGNSVQNGTPTPENPVPIESVADDVNLFDITSIPELVGGSTSYSVNNNTLKVAGPWFVGYLLDVDKNTDYYFSNIKTIITSTVEAGKILVMDNSKNNVIKYIYNENEMTFNTGSYSQIYILFYCGDGNYGEVDFTNIKLQKGTTSTPYSPYNYGTFTIDFEGQTENYNYTFITKPLRSLPNGVKDTIEEDGIHRRVGRVILDGTENFSVNSSWNHENTNLFILSNKITTTKEVLTNYFKYYAETYAKDINGIVGVVWGNKLAFRISNTIANSKSDFQAWLSTHNTEILYELETEVIEPYSEEQQEQYNKIKELYTFDGTTNISSTDVVPPYLQIQYYMKGE